MNALHDFSRHDKKLWMLGLPIATGLLLVVFYYLVSLEFQHSITAHELLTQKTFASSLQFALEKNRKLSDAHYRLFLDKSEALSLIAQISLNPEAEGNGILREKLYRILVPLFAELKILHLRQLHVHDKDGHSLLRLHAPKDFGDPLANIRPTIALVMASHKPVRGFEEGRVFNGFRNVYPLFHKETYVGSVELSFSGKIITENLKHFVGGQNFFLVHSEIVKSHILTQYLHYYREAPLIPHYFVDTLASSPELEKLKFFVQYYGRHIGKKLAASEDQFLSAKIDGMYYSLYTHTIFDTSDRPTAKLLHLHQDDYLDHLYSFHYMILTLGSVVILASSFWTYHFFQSRFIIEEYSRRTKLAHFLIKTGHWYLDLDTLRYTWCEQMYHLFAQDKESFTPTLKAVSTLVCKEDRKVFTDQYGISPQDQGRFVLEYRILQPTGNLAWMHETGEVLCDYWGRPYALFGVTQDITSQRRAEQAVESSRERFLKLSEVSFEGIILIDSYDKILYWNPAATNILGYSAEEMIGRQLHSVVVPPAQRKEYETGMQKAAITGQGPVINQRRQQAATHKQGHHVCLELAITSFRQQDAWFFVGTFRDITEKKRTEQALQQSNTVFENTSEAIIVTDKNKDILNVNPAFEAITGYAKTDVIGKNPRFLSSGHHDTNFFQQIWQSLEQNGTWQGEITNRKKSGALYTQWMTLSAVYDKEGEVTHYVALFSDITEFKARHEHYKFLAHHDPLSGLPNRELLTDRIAHAILNAERCKAPLFLLYIDLDKFKEVNDTYGHGVGDEVLTAVASRIEGAIRKSDTLARIGGDEFVALIETCSLEVDVDNLIARIHRMLREPIVTSIGKSLTIGASVGVAKYPIDGQTEKALLHSADLAMYEDKQKRRSERES